MINNSPASYVFIRACILFLHYIAPLSAVYCIIILLLRPSTYRIPLVLESWAIAETAFFALIYVPRTIVLQRAATHPRSLPREQRRKLFKLCLDTVEDPEKYLSGWMRGAPASEIKRENVKGETSDSQIAFTVLKDIEFLCWAFLNKKDHGPEDDDELEEYADETELRLGRKLEPGRGNAVSLRVTVDRFKSLHRSLLWYFVSHSGTSDLWY